MTRHILAATAAAAALALAGCGGGNTTNTADANMAAPMDTGMANTTADMAATPAAATGGQAFANAAAASDAFEIETSKLAATNAQAGGVKSFAQRMVEAHTESTAGLKTAAAAATPPITPDPAMTPEQTAQLTALRAATGAEFDRLYIEAQRDAHTKTLETLRAYAASGDVPSLKTFAGELAPKVAAHLNMANALRP